MAFAYFSLAFFSTLASGLLPLGFRLEKKRLHLVLSFSAGILVGVSFLQMIPEAFEHLGHQAGLAILLGYLGLFLLEKFVLIHPCEEGDCAVHHIGIPAFVGISFHTLIDGFALGASLSVPGLAWVILVALIAHKLPSAVSLSGILLAARYPKKQIVLLMTLFALTLPLGGFLAHLGELSLGPSFLGWAIGVSAGTFLSISTSDIFAQVHKEDHSRFTTLGVLLLGCAIAFLGGHLHAGH